jgi:hypothetical protein
MEIFFLWLVNFIQIVLISYQTKNITNNKYYSALICQLIISAVQVVFVHIAISIGLLPATIVMGTSGAIGIVVGMVLYQKVF